MRLCALDGETTDVKNMPMAQLKNTVISNNRALKAIFDRVDLVCDGEKYVLIAASNAFVCV